MVNISTQWWIHVLVLSACAFGWLGNTCATAVSDRLYPAFTPNTSQKELEYIVRQTTDVTCGPAALATVLNEYFMEDISEEQLYEAALRAMVGDTDITEQWPIVSLRGLLGALDVFGYVGYPVSTDFSNLEHYFAAYDVPVVIHFFKPLPHFTVLLGEIDGLFVVADPSVGRLVMTRHELASHWSGHALFIQPQSPKAVHAEKRRQQLEDVKQRTHHLRQAKTWL